MKRNILLFGLISGVIISTYMATYMALVGCSSNGNGSATEGMIIGFAAMIVAFSFVFIGIKNFRDKQNGGVITFGKAFLLGFMISLVASTLYVLTWAVEYHFFFPDFMEQYSTLQIKELHQQGVTGAKLEEAIKEIETSKDNYENNGFYFTAFTYLEILPVGIIITLISSLILKKKRPATFMKSANNGC